MPLVCRLHDKRVFQALTAWRCDGLLFENAGEPTMNHVPMNDVPFVASLILCLGLSFTGVSTQAAEPRMDPVAKENCIKACNECLRACRECLIHGGCPACDKTCLTCTETCRACVALMEYDSPLAKEMCKVCEEACKQCAAECNKCGDMPHAKRCAEACKKCEEACKALAM